MAKKKELSTRERRLRLLLKSTKEVPISHFDQTTWGEHVAVVTERHEGLTMCKQMKYCGTPGCTLGAFVASGLGTPEGIRTVENGDTGEVDKDGRPIKFIDFTWPELDESFNYDPFGFGKAFFDLDPNEADFLFHERTNFPQTGKKGKEESIRRINWLLKGNDPYDYYDKYGKPNNGD